MSAHAQRIEFLRRQQADLQQWVDDWPLPARFHARKKKTVRNLETVTNILRDLGALLIASGVRG